MMKGTTINDVHYNALSLEGYTEKAIQCCIDSWDRLCPEYPLKNLKRTNSGKRWTFCGSDSVTMKEYKECGQISKVIFSINNHITARSFRVHKDPSLVTVNCWIWWNCEGKSVRSWPEHILVDIDRERVVKFPYITPAISHFGLEPIPK